MIWSPAKPTRCLYINAFINLHTTLWNLKQFYSLLCRIIYNHSKFTQSIQRFGNQVYFALNMNWAFSLWTLCSQTFRPFCWRLQSTVVQGIPLSSDCARRRMRKEKDGTVFKHHWNCSCKGTTGMQCTQLQLLTTPKNSVSRERALYNVRGRQAQVQRRGILSTQGKQASPQAMAGHKASARWRCSDCRTSYNPNFLLWFQIALSSLTSAKRENLTQQVLLTSYSGQSLLCARILNWQDVGNLKPP